MATNLTGQDMGNWLWQKSDPNTQFNSYNPLTGQWSAGSLDGWTRDMFGGNEFTGITNEVGRYLIDNGFTGDFRPLGTDTEVNFFGGGRSGAEAREAWLMEDPNRSLDDLIKIRRNDALDQWLQSRGLTLQQGVQHTPGASQKTWIQRLVDAQGNPVAVDAHNDRYGAADRFTNGVQAALLVAMAAGAGGAMGGAEAGTTGGAGGGGAAAGGGGAGAVGGGAAGGGAAGGSFVMTPYGPAFIPTAAGGGGAIGGAIGGATAASMGMTGAGAAGGGAAAGGATGGGGAGMEGSLWDLMNAEGMGQLSFEAPGWLNTIGKGIGTVSDLVGGGQNLAALVGAGLGATQGGKADASTTQHKTDPRFDPYLYGDNGYLAQLQQQFNATKGGNADMTAGADMLRQLYTSPQYAQGYEQMRNVGQGLLGQGVAANPFTNPSGAPAGLLGAFTPVPRGQMPPGLLMPPERPPNVRLPYVRQQETSGVRPPSLLGSI